MSAVKMTFAISKSAAKLVKAGKAILSSGGVRDLTGQMIEMVKPVAPVASKAKLSLNPVLGGINLASSIGSNIQCAFIQQGVNAANAKLDDVMVRLEKMSRALSSLQTVQTLSWIGTSFSLANCGISVAGFYLTLSRLDRINGQLKEFYDRYKQDRQNDKIMRFNEILDNLKSDIGMLRNRAVNKTFTEMYFKNADPAITRLINEAKAFIESIIDDFENDRIDGEVACPIVFTIAAVLAQTINEFCCQYYYIHHIKHHMYEEWISFLDRIDSEKFRNAFNRFIQLNIAYVAMTPIQKAFAFLLAMEQVNQEKNRLATCSTLISSISEQEYYHLEDALNARLYLEIPKVMPELRGNLDTLITTKIMSEEYMEMGNNEYAMIPIE